MSTPLLYFKNAHLSMGEKILFSDADIQILKHDRICLVGRNGSGKTSLFETIFGNIELDSGDRFLYPGTRIGYLHQNTLYEENQTALEFVLEKISNQHEENESYLAEKILDQLNLPSTTKMKDLSGGMKRKASIASALAIPYDILLLDEPTNHLDLPTIEWLEKKLLQYSGSFICISHDRTFLTNITNKTLWIDRGKIRTNKKGYKDYDHWSETLLVEEEIKLKRQGKKLEAEEHWLTYGVTARRKRNQQRLEKLKELRKSLRTDKEKLNALKASISLPPIPTSLKSKVILEMDKVSKSYAENSIISNFSIRVLRKDRIGIIGPNGTGKTTLLKLITSKLSPDSGRIKLAKNATVQFLEQNRESLLFNKSLWENLCPSGGDSVYINGNSRHVIPYLKDFLFTPSQVKGPVSALSGGECNRLLLAKTLSHASDVLVLDEPTNDLDMDSLDMLQDILSQFDGTLLIVSHDRSFLDSLVNRTLVFEENSKINEYVGGYSDYIFQKKNHNKNKIDSSTKKNIKKTITSSSSKNNKLSYKLQRELDLLPEKIEKLTLKIHDLGTLLESPHFYNEDPALLTQKSKDFESLTKDLEELENRWLELEELKDSYQ